MRLPNWAKILWWAVLVAGLGWFLSIRFTALSSGQGVGIDALAIVLLVALLLAPLFSEISLFGVTLKQKIESLEAEVASIKIQNTTQVHLYPAAPPDLQLPLLEERIIATVNKALQAQGASPPSVTEDVPQAPSDVVYLFSLRRAIELEARRLAAAHNIDVKRHTLPWILDQLTQLGVVSYEVVVAVKDLLRVCTPAIHGDPVSPAQIAFAKDVGPGLLHVLKAV